MSNPFVQRVANWLAQEVVVKGLAENKAFQRFALRTDHKLKEFTEKVDVTKVTEAAENLAKEASKAAQKEKELAKEKEVLKERIAAAERQMNEEQARLVELVPRRQDLALKSAAFGLAELREDQERWDLEKKLRYEAIATQEETYRSLSQKQERMQAILHEREIWFGAIQEEQERQTLLQAVQLLTQ